MILDSASLKKNKIYPINFDIQKLSLQAHLKINSLLSEVIQNPNYSVHFLSYSCRIDLKPSQTISIIQNAIPNSLSQAHILHVLFTKGRGNVEVV